jgi:hypothetical protein
MNNDFEIPETTKVKNYTVKIDDYLHKRLDKHLRIIKHIEQKGLSKQKWVMDAIHEKLEKDKQPEADLPKDHYLVLKFNEPVSEQIESKVNYQRQFRDSYSKKQWLVAAIYEKLEREEQKAKELLEELAQNKRQNLQSFPSD